MGVMSGGFIYITNRYGYGVKYVSGIKFSHMVEMSKTDLLWHSEMGSMVMFVMTAVRDGPYGCGVKDGSVIISTLPSFRRRLGFAFTPVVIRYVMNRQRKSTSKLAPSVL